MANGTETSRFVSFAEFKLDLHTGELGRNGHHTVLQEKPFKVLTTLLERPGEMVTREELTQRLWPAGTFVDFNHGLNKAVNRLREALDDSADHPRFIETFPKRGYRFIGVLNAHHSASGEAAPGDPVDPRKLQVAASARRQWRLLACVAMVLAVAVGVLLWFTSQTPFRPLELRQRQLTSNSSEGAVTGGTISPDGGLLAYADLKGIHVKLIETGEVRDIARPENLRDTQVDWAIVPNWVNHGTEFLANALPHGGAAQRLGRARDGWSDAQSSRECHGLECFPGWCLGAVWRRPRRVFLSRTLDHAARRQSGAAALRRRR